MIGRRIIRPFLLKNLKKIKVLNALKKTIINLTERKIMAKIMDYKTLVKLSGKAIHNNKNRQISLDWLKDNENKPFPTGKGGYKAFKDLTFVIGMNFLHNDVEMRCEIIYTMEKNKSLWLDIDFDEFNKLGEYHGSTEASKR